MLHNKHSPPPISKTQSILSLPPQFTAPKEQWFTQPIDQLTSSVPDPTYPKTFQQRYFISDEFYQVGGPVFFYCG